MLVIRHCGHLPKHDIRLQVIEHVDGLLDAAFINELYHRMPFHVVIEAGVEHISLDATVGAAVLEERPVDELLRFIGVEHVVQTLPQDDFSVGAAGGAGDGASVGAGHQRLLLHPLLGQLFSRYCVVTSIESPSSMARA